MARSEASAQLDLRKSFGVRAFGETETYCVAPVVARAPGQRRRRHCQAFRGIFFVRVAGCLGGGGGIWELLGDLFEQ